MSAIIKLLALVTVLFAFNTQAKTGIKRIDPELIDKAREVAMALETYDGEFFDVSEIIAIKKYRGNINEILKAETLKLANGDEISVNAIRYFFVEKKANVPGILTKSPKDDE